METNTKGVLMTKIQAFCFQAVFYSKKLVKREQGLSAAGAGSFFKFSRAF